MSDINISVDASQVIGGKKAIDDFGVAFGKLVTKISREQRQLDAALKAPWSAQSRAIDEIANKMQQASNTAARENQKIINTNLGVTNSYKSATESAEAFVEVLRNQERIALQSTAALNQRLGVTGPNAAESGASFSTMEAEIERLSQKYNQIYASSRLYESSLKELDRAHLLGVVSTKQHEAAVESLNAEYQQFQTGTAGFGNRFAQQGDTAARSTNQLGVVVQQTGYQVGDFLVQVQSGTNWMVAFGQQATQLVGTLPLLAGTLGVSATRLIAISTGLGITIPLVTALGAVWMRSREDTDKAASSIQTLDDKLKSLDATLAQWLVTKEAAAAGITVEQLIGGQGIEKALEDMDKAQAAYNTLVANIQAQGNVVTGFGPGASAGVAISNLFALGNTLGDIDTAITTYSEAVTRVGTLQSKIAAERIALFKQEQTTLKQTQDIEAATIAFGKESVQVKTLVAAKERAIYEETLKTKIQNDIMVGLLMKQYDANQRNLQIMNNMKTTVTNVKSILASINGMQLAVSLKINTVVSGLPEWATGIWDKMSDIAWEGDLRGNETASRPPPRPPALLGEPKIESGGGGGGGGGGAGATTTLENKIEEIYKYLELEKYQIEQEEIAHKQRQDILKNALESKIITLTEYNDLEKALTEKHNQDLLDIEMRTKNTRLTELSGMFGALAGIMQSGGSKTAKIAATFGAVEATINSYVAATDALRKATTIPGKIAAYASVLATGLRGVAAIRSAGGVGGGGSAGPSSANVAPAAEAPESQTVYIDSIDPNGLYSGEALIRLFEAFYSENDKRGKVFVVRS